MKTNVNENETILPAVESNSFAICLGECTAKPWSVLRKSGLPKKTIDDAVSAYGASVKAKLKNVAIDGAPEDQLRGPLEVLFAALAELAGLRRSAVQLVGETTLSELKTRPDFAVTVDNILVGFIEVKAPGREPTLANSRIRTTRTSGTNSSRCRT
jgi:hypothetical protein